MEGLITISFETSGTNSAYFKHQGLIALSEKTLGTNSVFQPKFIYHKWFVYISIAHTIHISLYFFYYFVQIL